eukprot:s4794_g5.t1
MACCGGAAATWCADFSFVDQVWSTCKQTKGAGRCDEFSGCSGYSCFSGHFLLEAQEDAVKAIQALDGLDWRSPAEVDASGGRPAAVHEHFRAEIDFQALAVCPVKVKLQQTGRNLRWEKSSSDGEEQPQTNWSWTAAVPISEAVEVAPEMRELDPTDTHLVIRGVSVSQRSQPLFALDVENTKSSDQEDILPRSPKNASLIAADLTCHDLS